MECINYPAQVEQASLDLAELEREAMHQRVRLVENESNLTLEIANAKSPEGKPHFSNEATRNAEQVLNLRDN